MPSFYSGCQLSLHFDCLRQTENLTVRHNFWYFITQHQSLWQMPPVLSADEFEVCFLRKYVDEVKCNRNDTMSPVSRQTDANGHNTVQCSSPDKVFTLRHSGEAVSNTVCKINIGPTIYLHGPTLRDQQLSCRAASFSNIVGPCNRLEKWWYIFFNHFKGAHFKSWFSR